MYFFTAKNEIKLFYNTDQKSIDEIKVFKTKNKEKTKSKYCI